MTKAKSTKDELLKQFKAKRAELKKLEKELKAEKIEIPSAVGAPTVYNPKYPAMLMDHMSQGLSFESFGGLIRVGRATLYVWEKEHPEFRDAKKIGTELSLVFWEQLGNSGAAGHLPGFNAAAYCFNMKNRFSAEWMDRRDITTGGHRLQSGGGSPTTVVINLPRNGYESGEHRDVTPIAIGAKK